MKISLRKKAKQALLELDEDAKFEKSKIISSKISAELQKLTSQSNGFVTIGVFSPMGDEVRWYEALGDDSNIRFAVANVISSSEMEFQPIELQKIKSQKIGLTLDEELLGIAMVPEVMLVPALAFTPSCQRLGRGGGYYDRYLEKFGGLKIGICYECQIMEELVVDKHDVEMDLVITEENIYKKDR